ncbi:MAG: LamG domain-containing protein [Phycisphaerae bacterium]|nr:LamG domain-containing protein [Phycisphaerae bacterium]
MNGKEQKLLLSVVLLFFGFSVTALGDWDEGEPYKMHFPQLPDPFGWDIAFLSGGVQQLELADDWQCTATGAVSDIHFWTSWQDDYVGELSSIRVCIYSNDPCGFFSQPAALLWDRVFPAGTYTIRQYGSGEQGWYDPNTGFWNRPDHYNYYQINITDINDPFIQDEGTIYWLGIRIAPPEVGMAGWKTALPPVFMDNAVWRMAGAAIPWAPLYDPIEPMPIDLSFVITSSEEHDIKWEQQPNPNNCGLHAHDYDLGFAYERLILADDWQCEGGVVTDLHWWGAFEDVGSGLAGFHLSTHANDGSNCLPVEPALWEADIPIGAISATSTGVFNSIGLEIIKYEFVLPPSEYFYQEAGNTYWFNVCALSNDPRNSCLWTWQEAGRSAMPILCPAADKLWPMPDVWSSIDWGGSFSDMAFAITSIEEPNKVEKPLEPHTKWSQPVIETDPMSAVATYCGWDEPSHNLGNLQNWIMAADDFRCLGRMPVTSIHWWGSYAGWEGIEPPAVLPVGWRIGFWSNVADPNPYNPDTFSYPDELLWQVEAGANQAVEPSTISYWKFDEGAGTLAGDSVNGNDGTIYGAAWTSGKVGSALYFHGGGQWASSSDSVRVPYSASLDITGPFTVEAWIKATGTDKYNMIVDKHDGSAAISYGFSFYLTDGFLRFSNYGGTNGNKDASVPGIDLRDDTWHHVAGLWDGNDIKLYIDGELEAERDCNFGPASTTNDLGIGKRLYGWGGYLPFLGTIDEVVIYNTNLSEDKIKQHYQGGLPGYDVVKDGDCYQYNLYLEPNDYFRQDDYNDVTEDRTFWLSIAAVYPDGVNVEYPWGWHTRPWHWMDDAVRFPFNGTLQPGATLIPSVVEPIEEPQSGESYDLAFELDTEPNWIKWEQLYTGIRHWPHYEDELSMGATERWTEVVTKWLQEPDLSPGGIDVDATMELTGSPLFPPQILADDFLCTTAGPITDISIWGSWFYDEMPMMDPMAVEFTLSIYSDNPMGPSGWSEPNMLLWRMDFPAGAFMVEPVWEGPEGYYSPCVSQYYPQNHFLAWKYSFNIDPAQAFIQEGDPCEPVIYWLAVQARPIPIGPSRFGWKTSLMQWNDDAVWTIGEFDPYQPWVELLHPETSLSLDLAFEITTTQEHEEFVLEQLVADDWRCERRTPVTAMAWWGSYIGYGYEACSSSGSSFMPLPVKPDYFQLKIWTDTAAGEDPCVPYSHPDEVIWEYKAYDYDEVLVGYDKHPHGEPNEPVFRYSVRLPEEEWFRQPDVNGIFWLSVMAVYDVNTPNYDWGWTNHEHMFNDDAVAGIPAGPNEWSWQELFDQTDASEDMSFMLFTDPGECVNCADYNIDYIINFFDYADFADDWLWVGPAGGYNNSDLDCDGDVDYYDLKIFTDQWLDNCP